MVDHIKHAQHAAAYMCLDEWIVQALLLPIISDDVPQWRARMNLRGDISCGDMIIPKPVADEAHRQAVLEWTRLCKRDWAASPPDTQAEQAAWPVKHALRHCFYSCSDDQAGRFGVRPVIPGELTKIIGDKHIFQHIYYVWSEVFNPSSKNPLRMTW